MTPGVDSKHAPGNTSTAHRAGFRDRSTRKTESGNGVSIANRGGLQFFLMPSRYLVEVCLIAIAYYLLAKGGLALASVHPSASPVWPATGFALAAVLLRGFRIWPAIFLAALLANLTTAGSLLTSLGIATGNTLEAIVSGYLLQFWSNGRQTFDTSTEVLKFALVCIGPGTMISATLGVASLSVTGYAAWDGFFAIWMTWWLGDVAGALVVTPALLLWFTSDDAWGSREGPIESFATFLTAGMIGIVAFSPFLGQSTYRETLGWLAILPLIWAALKCDQRTTATVALILSAFAVWGVVFERGPFMHTTLNQSYLLLLMLIICMSVPSLTLSAAIAVRKRTEEALRESERKFRRVFEQSPLGKATIGLDVCLREMNPALCQMLGYTAQELSGRSLLDLVRPDGREACSQRATSLLAGEVEQFQLEERLVRKSGQPLWVKITAGAIRDSRDRIVSSLGIIENIEPRKAAEEALQRLNDTLEQRIAEEVIERMKAEDALRQAQKMEAVGQITGGVAHDFSNLLGVIAVNLETLQRRLQPEDPKIVRPIELAMLGVKRAAALTRRLLAFSRRQPLSPEQIDVNKIVTGMSELLRRTLGEHIAIETVLAGGLWRTFADENEFESALLNLAVNARDAIREGGKLTIETANVHLDEAYAKANEEVEPGQYVMIAVTDTGVGMTAEIIARAFEPFFTTKDVGRGTGLGLSQVYGYVKQSGGHVKIYSEPGEGTTVKIYLPRLESGEIKSQATTRPTRIPTGTQMETILVVEDDNELRASSVDVLRELGYRVLEAADGREALRILEVDPSVDLLFTDIGLPGGLNGRQLADEARRQNPNLDVLYTTGYARNAIVHQGRLDRGVDLIVKPFTYTGLAAKIGEILGRK